MQKKLDKLTKVYYTIDTIMGKKNSFKLLTSIAGALASIILPIVIAGAPAYILGKKSFKQFKKILNKKKGE